METVERLMKSTVEELEKLLNARNVLGEPIDRETGTVIPIVSYGFGFAAAGGAGGEGATAGNGGAAGAGGGIKPVGAVIIDADGARVEGIKGMAAGLADVVGETALKVMRSAGREVSKRTGKTTASDGDSDGASDGDGDGAA